MTETQKPFACSIKGCDMTFTNEDHLNWHQKKHDMMLNLGLAGKNNEVADQTPTPTRFIRNCEEVGLFQDLQNVNPFDEFFKKAVEAVKSGGTLEVPQSQTNSDDTLHTPHILPHIEETHKKISTSNTNENSHSNDFLNNVMVLGNGNNEISEIVDTSVFVLNKTETNIADDETHQKRLPNIKLKIKEALQTKDKQKNQNLTSVSLIPVRNLLEKKQVILDKKRNRKENNREKWKTLTSGISLEKVREMNRVAQLRCRKRKKEALKDMQDELKFLREEVNRLKTENIWLKAQVLKGMDDKNDNSNSGPSKESSQVDSGTGQIEQSVPSENTPKVPIPVMPKVPIPSNKVRTIPSPLIQLVQVVPAVTFPVTPNHRIDLSKSFPSVPDRKRKSLRKIVPRIVID